VPPRNEVKREMKNPGTVIGHYRPAATRAARGCSARDGQGNVGPRPARALQSARRQRPARRSSRARGRMVRRVRREESRSGRRSREPGARRTACAPGVGAARALRRSHEARAAHFSREARAARDDRARVLGRAGGRARATASGVTSRAVSEGGAIPAEASRIRRRGSSPGARPGHR
jgi:hypothetical protein